MRQKRCKTILSLCRGITCGTGNLIFGHKAVHPHTAFCNALVIRKRNHRHTGCFGHFAGTTDRFGKKRTQDHFRTRINRLTSRRLPALISPGGINRHQNEIIPGNIKHCQFSRMAHRPAKFLVRARKRQQQGHPLFINCRIVIIKRQQFLAFALGQGARAWPRIGIGYKPLIGGPCRVICRGIRRFNRRPVPLHAKQVRDTRGRITCAQPY